MHFVSTVDLASFLDAGVCGESLFDEAAHLLFMVDMTFDGINRMVIELVGVPDMVIPGAGG